MTTIAFSSTPAERDRERTPFDSLTATLSSRFVRLHANEIAPALVSALHEVTRAIGADACSLVEFGEDRDVTAMLTWPDGDPKIGPLGRMDGLPRWLLDRLTRHEVVAVSGVDDLPAEERALARQTGDWSGLAVPVLVAEQVACALVVWCRRAPKQWPASVIERMRTIAELFAVTVHRFRNDTALRASLGTITRRNARLTADNAYLREEANASHISDSIVGESATLRLALTRLAQVAPMDSSVLLLGETGTGKELFARALHDRSRRRTRTLVRVNCAALPPTLVESELFGHEKGAFTGAASTRLGRFELADGGTIFLDEIGDLLPEIQVKLLRVLQEGEFERVGSSRTKRVNVRVIAATHRDLEADVAAGRFRADLYYRLSVYPIHLPPLRERRDDIPTLVWFLIHQRQRELGRRITTVPEATMLALQQHMWPGNVRELENVIERALIHSSGETLQLDDTFTRAARPPAASGRRSDRGQTRRDPAHAHRSRPAAVSLAHQRRKRRGRATGPAPQYAPVPPEEARHRASQSPRSAAWAREGRND